MVSPAKSLSPYGPAPLRPRLVGAALAICCTFLFDQSQVVSLAAQPTPSSSPTPDPATYHKHEFIHAPNGAAVGPPAQPKPVVYLTFDDGPDTNTPGYLDLLASHDIQGTFFITGRNALNFSETTNRILDEGHTIGNHTQNHGRLTRSSAASRLGRAQESIRNVTGFTPTCYRPPFGITNQSVRDVAATLSLTQEWLWDVDTQDWQDHLTKEQVLANLTTTAGYDFEVGIEGPIVLMHDGGPDGPRSLEALAQWLTTNHYRYDFRTLENC